MLRYFVVVASSDSVIAYDHSRGWDESSSLSLQSMQKQDLDFFWIGDLVSLAIPTSREF